MKALSLEYVAMVSENGSIAVSAVEAGVSTMEHRGEGAEVGVSGGAYRVVAIFCYVLSA